MALLDCLDYFYSNPAFLKNLKLLLYSGRGEELLCTCTSIFHTGAGKHGWVNTEPWENGKNCHFHQAEKAGGEGRTAPSWEEETREGSEGWVVSRTC